jgi:putative FmdB family regulatory protein
MPIYEYRCEECGTVSEYLVGTGSNEKILCTVCGSGAMSRILSSSSFTFKTAEGRSPGRTCCGRTERCGAPPCSGGQGCARD